MLFKCLFGLIRSVDIFLIGKDMRTHLRVFVCSLYVYMYECKLRAHVHYSSLGTPPHSIQSPPNTLASVVISMRIILKYIFHCP